MLDPSALMEIKDLSLLARTVVDGFLPGYHKSAIKGPGLEFSQYRSYQPGDDLRQLDWRMAARSDRYYVRESEVESSISVRLLIDASASMNHEDQAIRKIDYARFLAAALAFLANQQGDSTGLCILSAAPLFSLAPKSGPAHFQKLCGYLEKVVPNGSFPPHSAYKELLISTRRRELMILITDGYQSEQEIMDLLDELTVRRHEVIVFHLIGQNELDCSFPGSSALEELETGKKIDWPSPQGKKIYLENLTAHLDSIQSFIQKKGIRYELICLSQPLDSALRLFLKFRRFASPSRNG